MYYDTCTRAKVDGTPNMVEDFYWCPDPAHVDKTKNNLFLPNKPNQYGLCHNHVKPPGTFQAMIF